MKALSVKLILVASVLTFGTTVILLISQLY